MLYVLECIVCHEGFEGLLDVMAAGGHRTASAALHVFLMPELVLAQNTRVRVLHRACSVLYCIGQGDTAKKAAIVDSDAMLHDKLRRASDIIDSAWYLRQMLYNR